MKKILSVMTFMVSSSVMATFLPISEGYRIGHQNSTYTPQADYRYQTQGTMQTSIPRYTQPISQGSFGSPYVYRTSYRRSTPTFSNAAKGTFFGALAGNGLTYLTGNNRTVGTVAGGVIGYLIGSDMDKKEKNQRIVYINNWDRYNSNYIKLPQNQTPQFESSYGIEGRSSHAMFE